jgi:hypothetical protein
MQVDTCAPRVVVRVGWAAKSPGTSARSASVAFTIFVMTRGASEESTESLRLCYQFETSAMSMTMLESEMALWLFVIQ